MTTTKGYEMAQSKIVQPDLPPLPEPYYKWETKDYLGECVERCVFSDSQMRAYAAAAVLAERELAGARLRKLQVEIEQLYKSIALSGVGARRDTRAAVLAERERVVKTIGDHIEGKLHAWRQSTMNKSGDRLALDDFMGEESINDLVDFVCDQWALGAAIRAEPKEQQP